MKITQDKQYTHYKKSHTYLGTVVEKGIPVDLYFDAALSRYVARYGSEKDNYTAMDVKLAASPAMITHVMHKAHNEKTSSGV